MRPRPNASDGPQSNSSTPRPSAVAAPSAPSAPSTDGHSGSRNTDSSSNTASRIAPEQASTSGRPGVRRLHLYSTQHAPLHRHGHQQHQQHPTLRLIASRLRSGTQPGARHDGARLGLVVEGGGMRGCISGAMLMALHDLGISDVFDVVYGASAGAINATYFLTGQRCG